MSKSLTLDSSTVVSYKHVEIQPVVIFTILDHYIRRPKATTKKDDERVIGTLLGRIDDGIVLVSNCFTVPHTEEQLSINMIFHQQMSRLHKDANPDEQIVGWYSTTKADVLSNSMLINDFYTREMVGAPPIFLYLDTTLKTLDWVRCMYLYDVQIGDRKLQRQFRPLRHILVTDQAERTILNAATKITPESKSLPLSDVSGLIQSLKELVEMLDSIKGYIDAVVNQGKPGSTKVAKMIDQILSVIPTSPTGKFEDVFTRGLQDILACVYLARLTNAHLMLANKGVVTESRD